MITDDDATALSSGRTRLQLESATVNIFSMPHLYDNDNNLNIVYTVNNAVNTLAYTIPVVAG